MVKIVRCIVENGNDPPIIIDLARFFTDERCWKPAWNNYRPLYGEKFASPLLTCPITRDNAWSNRLKLPYFCPAINFNYRDYLKNVLDSLLIKLKFSNVRTFKQLRFRKLWRKHYPAIDTRRIAFEVIKTRVHEREPSTSIGFSMLIRGWNTREHDRCGGQQPRS